MKYKWHEVVLLQLSSSIEVFLSASLQLTIAEFQNSRRELKGHMSSLILVLLRMLLIRASCFLLSSKLCFPPQNQCDVYIFTPLSTPTRMRNQREGSQAKFYKTLASLSPAGIAW